MVTITSGREAPNVEKTTTKCELSTLFQNIMSYQDNWELVTLWVRNIPVDGQETSE